MSQLQDMLCSFKETAIKSNNSENKVAALKDKLNSSNLTINELRNRIKTLEENSEKKDSLLREWNGTIEQFEVEMKRLIEENFNYITERELIKSSLNHVSVADADSEDDSGGSRRRAGGGRAGAVGEGTERDGHRL